MGLPFAGSRTVRLAAVLALVLLVLAASPPVRSGGKGALLMLDVLPTPVSPLALLTPEPRRQLVDLPSTEADLYRPRGFTEPPGLVLIHGANPGGKDDPRVVDLATSLARTGRTVLVPNLGLRDMRLDPDDQDRIREAVAHLGEGGSVSMLAFSYGAALALVALADRPDLQESIAVMATFGTYFDLRHLIGGATTEQVPYGDELVGWEPHPEAEDHLVEQVGSLLEDEEAEALERAWEAQDPEGLAPETRAAYELLANEDPERVPELIDALGEDLQQVLVDLSPSEVVDRIRFPVYALHDRGDPAAPVTESRLLVEHLEGRVDARLTEVDMFDHVFPALGPLGNIPDARRVMTFAGSVLRTQEGWPRI